MKNIKNLLLIFGLILLGINNLISQQNEQFTLYLFNPLTNNPAYAGSRDALSVSLLGRNQWVGIDGAPKTASLTMHTPFKKESFAAGFSFIHDQIGPSKNTSVYGSFAYRIKVSEKSRLSLGLKAGVDMYNANFIGLIVKDPNDALYYTPIENSLLPNFGLGVYWFSEKHYLGLSAPRILENKYKGLKEDITNNSKQDRHYFLMGGLNLKVNSIIDFVPSFQIKAVKDAPLSIDVNANFIFFDKLWFGAGYRFGDAILFDLVYHFTPKFRMGVGYDQTTSELSNYNDGSFEILFNYDLDFLGKGFKTPRKF